MNIYNMETVLLGISVTSGTLATLPQPLNLKIIAESGVKKSERNKTTSCGY